MELCRLVYLPSSAVLDSQLTCARDRRRGLPRGLDPKATNPHHHCSQSPVPSTILGYFMWNLASALYSAFISSMATEISCKRFCGHGAPADDVACESLPPAKIKGPYTRGLDR